MAKRIDMLTSMERWRRWSASQKEEIVTASLVPGAVASNVARRAGIHMSQLFRWRKQLRKVAPDASTQLLPVTVVDALLPCEPDQDLPAPRPSGRTSCRAGIMEMDLGQGRRVRVGRDLDAATLRVVLDVLGQR